VGPAVAGHFNKVGVLRHCYESQTGTFGRTHGIGSISLNGSPLAMWVRRGREPSLARPLRVCMMAGNFGSRVGATEMDQ